jgi:hypothetical protein
MLALLSRGWLRLVPVLLLTVQDVQQGRYSDHDGGAEEVVFPLR